MDDRAEVIYRAEMFGGGPSALMYVLRGRALENERGEHPDLTTLFAPGTIRQARRRTIAVWLMCASWIIGLAGGLLAVMTFAVTLTGSIVALATQFEADWIGSPVRRWARWAIGFALVGMVMLALVT
jgi:hypothetical protein